MLSRVTAERLHTQLDVLPLLLDGATAADLERRPAEGKWSAHENLAHLARMHEVMLERLGSILDSDRPRLARYWAEDDPDWPRWPPLPTRTVLARLHALRAELISRVDALTPVQLARSGIHSAMGAMPLSLWLEFFLLHEAHHLYTVLQRLRIAEPAP